MGEHRQALLYATQHLIVSKELDDPMGQATAQMNVSDLRKVLGITGEEDLDLSPGEEKTSSTSRRKSMEEMNLIRMTPEAAAASSRVPSAVPGPSTSTSSMRTQRSLSLGQVLFHKGQSSSSKMSKTILKIPKTSVAEDEEGEDQDAFFDLLSKCQTERMDDQRCTMPQASSRSNNTLQCSDSSSSSSRPPLVSKGSFNQQHHNNLRMLGNKENKDKKSKTLPARANSLPSGPNYPAKSPPAVDTGNSFTGHWYFPIFGLLEPIINYKK